MTDFTRNPRHDRLVALISENGYMNLEELAEILNVSAQTVRRDIKKLSRNGLISRYHGGAGPVSSTANVTLEEREVSQEDEKSAIAHAIADYVPEGSTVFITIGTTVEFIARALNTRKKVRVITNSLRVAHILYRNKEIETIVPAGVIRAFNGGIVGPSVVQFIEGFRADYMITSMGAIDQDGSILEFNVDEGTIAKSMIEHSRHLLLAADHTKFQRSAAVEIGNIRQASVLFTDETPGTHMVDYMAKHQVELKLCRPLKREISSS
jgi:DeoR/GlpR family transcriptional regulator of sugar metabolism